MKAEREAGLKRVGRGGGGGVMATEGKREGGEGGREDEREKVKIKWWKRRRSGGLTEKGFVKLERKRGAEIARRGDGGREKRMK